MHHLYHIKFLSLKDKSELKTYLMDRLDNDTSGNGLSKPIIMENNQLIN